MENRRERQEKFELFRKDIFQIATPPAGCSSLSSASVMALEKDSSSEEASSSETRGTTRKNGGLVQERPQTEKELSEGTSQDVVVLNMSRGPAYHFTSEER